MFRSAVVTLLFVLSTTNTRADILNFTAPATAQPASKVLSTTAIFGLPVNWLIAYQAMTYDATTLLALPDTLDAQGFNATNGWNPLQYVGLAADSSFTVTNYSLSVPAWTVGRATFNMTFSPGSFTPPANSSFHWLQLVHTDKPLTTEEGGVPFGYNVYVTMGYWQIDNGAYAAGPNIGPFYDSNGFPAATYNFVDNAQYADMDLSSSMGFWLTPSWEVIEADGTHTIHVANTGVGWGMYDPPGAPIPNPAPPGAILALMAVPIFLIRAWRNRRVT